MTFPSFLPVSVRSLVALFALAASIRSSAAEGFDLRTPAEVTVVVTDETGQPVPNARVEVTSTPTAGPTTTATATSDARGRAVFRLSDPHYSSSAHYRWFGEVSVQKDGFITGGRTGSPLFPSARIEWQVTLEPAQTTLIHFRGPDGRPLPGIAFNHSLDYGGLQFADGNGDFRLIHGRSPNGFWIGGVQGYSRSIGGGGFSRRFPDQPREVTVTLSAVEMEAAHFLRPIRGQVLRADGTPAAGWRLASNIQSQSGGSGTVNGLPFTMPDAVVGRDLMTLPRDGTFEIHTMGLWLVVLSPEGVPFRFPVNTQARRGGSHEVTLRIPPAERTHEGRLQYADGSRAAGVGIALASQKSETDAAAWRFVAATGFDHNPAAIVTDADGRYRVPIHAGILPHYAPVASLTGFDSASFLNNPVTTLVRFLGPTRESEGRRKHVRIALEDDNGRPITGRTDYGGPSMETFPFGLYVPGNGNPLPLFRDTTGLHAFPPYEARTLKLAPQGTVRNLPAELNLSIEADQTIPLVIPADDLPQPLSGVILDAEGRPVPRVSVAPFVWRQGTPPTRDFFGLGATTDAQGRFHFAAAPEAGALSLHRYDATGNNWDLPGWVAAPAYSQSERNLTIRLERRTGSARVQLAPATKLPLPTAYLRARDPALRSLHINLIPDNEARAVAAVRIPPGTYELFLPALNAATTPADPFIEVAHSRVEIGEGTETLVDLTDVSFPAPRTPEGTPPLLPGIVTVRLNGRPFAGATVRPTSGALASGLPNADTSDRDGRAWTFGESGETLTIEAHVPGQWIGTAVLTFPQARDTVIDLHPSGNQRR